MHLLDVSNNISLLTDCYILGFYKRTSVQCSHNIRRREVSCQPWLGWYCLLLGSSLPSQTWRPVSHVAAMCGCQWQCVAAMPTAPVVFGRPRSWQSRQNWQGSRHKKCLVWLKFLHVHVVAFPLTPLLQSDHWTMEKFGKINRDCCRYPP